MYESFLIWIWFQEKNNYRYFSSMQKSYLFLLCGCNVKSGQKEVAFVLLQFLAGVNDECAGGILHFKVALPFLPCHAIIFNGNNNSLKPGRHFFCFIYRSLEQSALMPTKMACRFPLYGSMSKMSLIAGYSLHFVGVKQPIPYWTSHTIVWQLLDFHNILYRCQVSGELYVLNSH